MASTPLHPEHHSLREVLSSARSVFVAVGLFSFATNLLMLAVPLYMMQLFDRVLATRNVDTLVALTMIVLVSILVMGALESVRSRLMVRCGPGIERRLSPEVLEGSARAARRGDAGSEPGGQSLRDLAAVRSYLGGPAVMSIFDAPYVPVFLAVVFLIHPMLGSIALGGALVLFGLAYANEQFTRPPVQEGNRESTRALNEADAALRNFDVIEALGMMETLKRRLRSSSGRALASHEEASDRGSMISASARVLRLTIQVAMLGTGAWLAMSDAISGGAMIAASIIAGRALSPFEQSINGWKMLIGARQAFARVRELLQREFEPGEAMTLPEPEGKLSVEGLIYIPRGSTEPVLRDISFELAPGTSLGIIGPSAAGKTTLVRHLVGSLEPSRGHVRLDSADLIQWDSTDRGRWVGYLPQDVELFAGSVRENIARLREVDDDTVVQAAMLAGAHEAILRLPQGYETLLQAGGGGLSGGQRQRVGLARAVLGNPRLVVLDEPNANLDGEGEQALMRALAELKRNGTTLVMVAHRPGVMGSMDKLLLLREGRVMAFGDREEVLGRLTAPQGIGSAQRAASGSSEGS